MSLHALTVTVIQEAPDPEQAKAILEQNLGELMDADDFEVSPVVICPQYNGVQLRKV